MEADKVVMLVIGVVIALTTLGGVVASIAVAISRVRSIADQLSGAIKELGYKLDRSNEIVMRHEVEIAKLWTTVAERISRDGPERARRTGKGGSDAD